MMTKLVFSHPPPDFNLTDPAEKLKNWEGSVYYWWYEYLKCNDEYKNYCVNISDPSFKSRSKKLDRLYEEFGDIHTKDFETWWKDEDRGNNIFSEGGWWHQDQFTIFNNWREIDPSEVTFCEDGWVFIRVPLKTQSKRSLKKSFSNMLDQLHKGKRGERTLKNSEAVYKVLGRTKVASLKLHMEIYKFRMANPKTPSYDIFDILGLHCKPTFPKGSTSVADKTSIFVKSITVSRHLRKAKNLINNTIFGRFPDYKNQNFPSKKK